MIAAAIVSVAATTATAHVNHVPLCHVATNLLLLHAVTSLPMHHEAKVTEVMHHVVTSHLVIASVLLRHAVIAQRLLRAATSPLSLLVVTVPLAATANATSHHAVTNLLSLPVATSPSVANAHAATILSQANVRIARRLIVLPTQASQPALPVTLLLVPPHRVERLLRRVAIAQHVLLAHHVQVHRVPQPVHAAVLTLTAVAVNAAR